ncbi:DegV family protein [Risungbinella massiliensis]|uniref:DegV family protein n=1 Tax=Risungbinella massiliensis TaxID=1329796 RepID=UPI0005CBCF10|nr:DegV family protein [Risungbinella massiliensis]
MSKIAILTDSSCDLPQELIEKYPIHVVPLRLIYQNGEYRDGVDITADEFYTKLEVEIPTTSMPSPQDLQETFQQIEDQGFTHVLAITISSGLSGTFNTFRLMAEDFPNLTVQMIDSKGLSWLLGYQVVEAAKLVQEGFRFDETIERIHQLQPEISGYFIVDTLDYLKRGGRIGSVTATLGSLLSLKPIITVDGEGKFFSYRVARGKKQALKKLMDIVEETIESTRAQIAVVHSKAKTEAEEFANRLRELENVVVSSIGHISPAMAVHTGPGMLGLIIQREENS